MLKESQIYKNYMTNEDGTHIINVKTGKKFEPYMSNSGYYYVAGIPVHRIVASAFKYDSYFKKATVDHIDGDKLNNHVSNLEWVSQSENEKRSYQNGRQGAWTDKNKIYPAEGRIKQSQKIKGANNPASKKELFYVMTVLKFYVTLVKKLYVLSKINTVSNIQFHTLSVY